jgi:transcriptional regulator with XRE-family HTH domain
MITGEQIRAARALLDWKQSDLARESGLSLPSINNIERHIGSPRVDTLRAIQLTCEKAGIEFIGQQGVKKHSEQFTIDEYQGYDFIRYLYDDFLACMNGPEDVVLMSGIDDRKFPEYAPDQTLRYYEHHVKTQFIEKALLVEGDTYYLSDPTNYRWISAELLGQIPYWLYKNRLVMIMWDVKRVVIIRSQSIVDTFEKQFNFLWNMAKPVPPHARNLLEDPTYREKIKKSKPRK